MLQGDEHMYRTLAATPSELGLPQFLNTYVSKPAQSWSNYKKVVPQTLHRTANGAQAPFKDLGVPAWSFRQFYVPESFPRGAFVNLISRRASGVELSSILRSGERD